MFTISDTIHIHAPIQRCFLLSTNVHLLQQTLGMHLTEGTTEGLAVGGDRLLWTGWKFGLSHRHETLVTRYKQPEFFQDTMQRGRFKRFQHDHSFIEIDGQTLLTDKLRFSLPLGWLGRKLAKHLLVPYIARLLRDRLELLKQIAESEEWRRYLPDDNRTAQSAPAIPAIIDQSVSKA